MKWFFPREHGAWAMLTIPYWTAALAGGVTIHHLLFFIGIFLIYLTQAPLMIWIKNPGHQKIWPSLLIYLFSGLLFVIPYIFIFPFLIVLSLMIFPFFIINILFAKWKKERLFLNDLSAIIGLSSLAILAWHISGQQLNVTILQLLIFQVVFFTGSVFHVKSLIRERQNDVFNRMSKIYHVALCVYFYLAGSIVLLVVGLMTLSKTLFLNENYLNRPAKIGIVEIINSIVFFAACLIYF